MLVKRAERDGETCILCISEGRSSKDAAIRRSHEERLIRDLQKLEKRAASGRLKKPEKIWEAIGRIKERYPRVARYYSIEWGETGLKWEENAEKKAIAEALDGAYLLKTDRTDLGADEAWRVYSMLTRAESAFRAMKSPLSETPIFHQTQNRVEAHIFLCILAYHLLVAVEKTLRDNGLNDSWATVRDTLSSHQTVTVVLPTTNRGTLRIRCGSAWKPTCVCCRARLMPYLLDWALPTSLAGRRILLMGQTPWEETSPYSKAPVSMKAAWRRYFGEIAFTRGSVNR